MSASTTGPYVDEEAYVRAPVPVRTRSHPLLDTGGLAPAIARLTLGLVIFPHSAQKILGLFGGPGLAGAYAGMTHLGLPGWLAIAAITVEAMSVICLVLGLFTRVASLGIMAIMIGAIVTVHWPNGFFMNWMGKQAGEGFEYHLLAIGLALVCLLLGGGIVSIDRALARSRD